VLLNACQNCFESETYGWGPRAGRVDKQIEPLGMGVGGAGGDGDGARQHAKVCRRGAAPGCTEHPRLVIFLSGRKSDQNQFVKIRLS
jgi:hypothetical protein